MRGQNLRHSGGGMVMAPDNGVVVRKLNVGICSSPAVDADGAVFVGGVDGNVSAVDINGTIRWRFPTGHYVQSSPAINSDGTVYAGSSGTRIYAIDAYGHEKWRFATSGRVTSSPVVGADGTVYVGSEDNRLYALDPTSGQQRWNFSAGGSIISSPALSADTVFFGSLDQSFYAVATATGAQKWVFPTRGAITSSPSYSGKDRTVYFGSDDGHLYAFGDSSENLKWSYPPSFGSSARIGPIASSPTIGAEGTVFAGWVFVGSDDHSVYAVDRGGNLKWTFATNGSVLSSPAVSAQDPAQQGTVAVFVGSAD